VLLAATLAACLVHHSPNSFVPGNPDGRFTTAIQHAYVHTDYGFGLSPLGVEKGKTATIESVALTGVTPGFSARVEAVATATSPVILGAIAGAPERRDPKRFVLLPVRGLRITGTAHGEDHYLVGVLRASKLGDFKTTGLDVTFRSGSALVTRHYPYYMEIQVTHASGRDWRLDI
jgi:hypothetical protein